MKRGRRYRVLFVCLGNICRSPMAEAMARKYGSDVLIAESAGLTPAPGLPTYTRAVLLEKNIEPCSTGPVGFDRLNPDRYDLIVNMSGRPLPGNTTAAVEDWPVDDPFGGSEEDYRTAREHIEMRVMNLILRMRAGKFGSTAAEPQS